MLITDKITITLEDNMALMARYPDNYFDLAIVDPPYGINATNMQMGSAPNRNEPGQYSGTSVAVKVKGRKLNKSVIDWDNEKPTKEYFDELFRVSKNQIIWGGNYFDLPPTRCFIVWNKNQPWDNFSQAELAWTSFDKPAKLFTYSNRGGANDEEKIHPTQKPVFLYDYCLKHFATAGMKILDTHLGSGSIAVSCHNYSYELVCCETNEIYFEDTIKRLKRHVEEITLF